MFGIRINKNTFRMKIHYFLYLGGVASVQGFAPTISRQLGYSPLIVGYLYTYLALLALFVKPVCGFIVDKFPVKRYIFLTFVLASGIGAFSLMFVDKLPTEAVANLICDSTTVLKVCSNKDRLLPQCDNSLFKFLKNNSELVKCQLFCRQNTLFWNEMCKSWSLSDYCITSNNTFNNNDLGHLNLTLRMITADHTEKSRSFQVSSVQINEKEIQPPVCQRPVSTRCNIECSDDVIMGLATITKLKDNNVFVLHQFWVYVAIFSFYWISQAITWNLQDPICFDILGENSKDFGKQRCWGSISWGLFSILGGLLVDYFSKSDVQKNYTPIYYLCLITILCDLAVAYHIKVPESFGHKSSLSDVFKILTKWNVIIYFMWIIILGVCSSLPWNYLAWYMEDITFKYHKDKQSWIKTLQGLTSGIQCIGGEVPFLFFSGWIIKRIGYWYCMSLGLFSCALRFYLYSIITNPVWILPVEFLNGITFGLCHAVLVAYARIIAPSNSVTTLVGLAGALYEGVGTSLGGFLGGFLYEKYGGAWTFKVFAYGSLLTGILHISYAKINKLDKYQIDELSNLKDLKLAPEKGSELIEIIFYSPWNARNVLLTNHDIKLFVKEPN